MIEIFSLVMINYAVQCLLFELVKTDSMTVLYQIISLVGYL